MKKPKQEPIKKPEGGDGEQKSKAQLKAERRALQVGLSDLGGCAKKKSFSCEVETFFLSIILTKITHASMKFTRS